VRGCVGSFKELAFDHEQIEGIEGNVESIVKAGPGAKKMSRDRTKM